MKTISKANLATLAALVNTILQSPEEMVTKAANAVHRVYKTRVEPVTVYGGTPVSKTALEHRKELLRKYQGKSEPLKVTKIFNTSSIYQ